ncbi:glycosyltransferase family 2 protein [Paenibacillus sp. GCM10027627]|uniref:glycosyltransferase family 2 protein n=1 Tax=unclassified Paenibacillus TaxID=185978 RepID=UPI00362FDD11
MKTSIVILTHNQFHHTVLCLESIRKHTPEEYELIFVDNASTDMTKAYLELQPDVRLINNAENRGFAVACNQGLEAATGEAVLFLNNDTVVTPGWLGHMLQALQSSPDVGMCGPFTNYASGHQVIKVPYTDLLDLDSFAIEHGSTFEGTITEVRRLIGFCLLVRRSVLDEIGGFDELFGLGNFEDDDLCLRAAFAGYRLVIANASFVHHVGHATMKEVRVDKTSLLLYQNRYRALEKWGTDIFSLLYKKDIRLTCCIKAANEKQLLESLHSISGLADEVIVVDLEGQFTDLLLSSAHVQCLNVQNVTDSTAQWKQAIEAAREPYLLLLEAGESVSDRTRRQLRALKRTIPPQIKAVATDCGHEGTEHPLRQIRLFHRSYPFTSTNDHTENAEHDELLESSVMILSGLA